MSIYTYAFPALHGKMWKKHQHFKPATTYNI